MADDPRLAALIDEYRTLDRQRDGARLCALLAEAAPLVDRSEHPLKWAAMRMGFAQLSAAQHPAAALDAYRDALGPMTAAGDEASASECHQGIASLLLRAPTSDPATFEEARGHFEAALSAHPENASVLAALYEARVGGDPFENWEARVRCLRLALSQDDRAADPVRWAHDMNELGKALGERPGAPSAAPAEERIACHAAALAALAPGSRTWTATQLHLCEAYEQRVLGDAQANRREARAHVDLALDSCADADSDLRRVALMSKARMLATPPDAPSGDLEAAQALLARAAALLDPARDPVGFANVEQFAANLCVRQIERGFVQQADALVAHCESALAHYAAALYADRRRAVLQAQGEGLMAACRHGEAEAAFAQAIALCEVALAQATTTAGRLERIFQLADTRARAAWCLLQIGRADDALECLERGKARLWTDPAATPIVPQLHSLVPPGGALLFPLFVRDAGAVLVVTAAGGATALHVCHLPRLTGARVRALQCGPDNERLGGWLGAYAFRRSDPAGFRSMLESIGATLYADLWQPLLDLLGTLGVGANAELVWCPQGHLGGFPVHAAWCERDGERRPVVADHPIRQAPAAHVLLAARAPGLLARSVVVANPTGDLAHAELEAYWVAHTWGEGTQILADRSADATRVRSALAHCDRALLSTHARFDFAAPLDSSILLANGESVTLAEWLSLVAQEPPAHVSLSACETAVTQVTSMPDELIGLPTGLLARGVASVLGTLWPVDDDASAFLVGRFHAEWSRPGVTTAQALARAQNWLRTATVRELRDALGELRSDPGPLGALAAQRRSALAAEDPQRRPFDHPYYWAAYVVCGRAMPAPMTAQ